VTREKAVLEENWQVLDVGKSLKNVYFYEETLGGKLYFFCLVCCLVFKVKSYMSGRASHMWLPFGWHVGLTALELLPI